MVPKKIGYHVEDFLLEDISYAQLNKYSTCNGLIPSRKHYQLSVLGSEFSEYLDIFGKSHVTSDKIFELISQ
jgi:hypothetical protein